MSVATQTNSVNQPNAKKKHPPGLYLLFATEAWERFSYYGMRALLVLYLTSTAIQGGLGFKESWALSLYGLFTGLVYFTPIIGGWLTDNFIAKRTAITIGGIIMAAGNIVLFGINSATGLYIGLTLLILGNGFFKPNISTLVGELYEQNDDRRDGAFTIFYMGINVGAFFAPLVVGYLSSNLFATHSGGVTTFGYKYGFLAAAIGMIIGQVCFNLLGNKFLGDKGTQPNVKVLKQNASAVDKKIPLTKKEKQRTLVIVILTCFVIFFWAGFEQAGSSLTLYTDKFINRQIGSFTVPTEWFQSINPLFIVLLAPILSSFWIKLARSGKNISIPAKMAMGIILLGCGFIFVILAVMKTGSDPNHITVKANIIFMVLTYFFHTLGELVLSPVGLSAVSKYAPLKYASLLMGVWTLSSFVANTLSGYLAALTTSLGMLEVFIYIGAVAVGIGLILLAISPKLAKMLD
ncbi:peptide MFS transporter [Bacillus sp. RG28]|uniref:Peptide MFS transporter n=1 Tax=Gottfriedia endophytica TaxID=2820819 RepID=A0A940SH73_9BACI|nr:peptide MFS transporter [Gottfriedia endophytica]MBP0725882.1 peptide MFS transporter [Gottfriedia endophytica]